MKVKETWIHMANSRSHVIGASGWYQPYTDNKRDTPIANSVIGHVTDENLQKLLRHIRQLNKSGNFRGRGIPEGLGEY